MPDYIHRKTVLDTIRRNSMLRVQDIYDAVESLPVTHLEQEKTPVDGDNEETHAEDTNVPTKPYDFLYEEGGVNDG